MAERNPPAYLQGGSHPADLDRLALSSFIASAGVSDLGGGHLAVVQQGTPGMGVTVAAGYAWVAGDEATDQGFYGCQNDAAVDIAVAASDPTNPRIDLVVARVRDSFYSGADDDWLLAVVTGTPAASPAEPPVPDNALVLARVDVAATDASITDAEITDRRVQSYKRGQFMKTLVFGVTTTFEKADHPGLDRVRGRAVAGGGAGGGMTSTTGGSGGGGSGAYAEFAAAVADLGTSETVTIGAGATGNNGAGSNGGSTSFGSLANVGGGLGGQTPAGNADGGRGGNLTTATGGFGTGGAAGGNGSEAQGTSTSGGGHGGSGPWGGGGRGFRVNAGSANGFAADGYGSGGGGAYRGASGNSSGGDGADGVIILDLYA